MKHAFVLTKRERKEIINLINQILEMLGDENIENINKTISTSDTSLQVSSNLLNSKEAAEDLHMSLRTLQKLRDKDKIKYLRISNKNIKYTKDHLEEFLSNKLIQEKSPHYIKNKVLSEEYIITSETHLNVLPFDVRTLNALKLAGLLYPEDGKPRSLKDLYDFPFMNLINFRNVGVKTIENLMPYFEKAGLDYISY